ncbi:GTP cyclohydrolase I [Mobilisporobacter senegalensis]|uniref:GTP cyclohydrolase 1 n=1 Tax=Mobilisporobacter senegalensis TaxID=1329262 RepID=A0A3N1XN93_9FIRM|nr:GTP cyclohydrolase I FolE [Mobilisporobacter senegalensis]ROR28155.1 GTP cyclohydrolase I [Mobilisporobacter senegalensis]
MIDEKKIEQAVRLFLEGIGEDADREGLAETPRRISTMCSELFAGLGQDAGEHLARTFQADNNEMVLERDITFYSVCEHHFLPFYGKAHIAYIPDGKVVGISKLARTVEVYARRPQIQEQMTAQIADDIMKNLKPKGVMVMIEAEHMCMTMRGVKKPGTTTVTHVCRGEFENNESLKNTFFHFIR